MEDNFNVHEWNRNRKISNYEKGNKLNEDFNPQIAGGSVYAIEVKPVDKAKVELKQDNGQSIVVHVDDIRSLIKELRKQEEAL